MDTVGQYNSDEEESILSQTNKVSFDYSKHKLSFEDGISQKSYSPNSKGGERRSSPIPKSFDEKMNTQENCLLVHKTSKRNKTKTLKDDVEQMMRIESEDCSSLSIEEKLLNLSGSRRNRSRSKSSERGLLFRKREKKVRNYRRSGPNRSPSPLVNKEKPTEKNTKWRYPKNWSEFNKEKWNFDKLKSKFPTKASNDYFDITKHLLFKTPAAIIKPFYYRNEKNEEVLVPYQYVRHTSATPSIPFNVNFHNIKENFLTRQQILSLTHKNLKPILEKFWNNNMKTKFRRNEPIGQRNWYQKTWKDNESKLVENSIGLSFLQNYSEDDEEDEDFLSDIPPLNPKSRNTLKSVKEMSEFNATVNKAGSRKKEDTKSKKYEDDLREFSSQYKMPNDLVRSLLPPEKLKSPEINKTQNVRKEKHEKIVIERKGRNKTKSESMDEEMPPTEMSWTPERIDQDLDKIISDSPKKKPKTTLSDKIPEEIFNNIKEKKELQETNTDDEWNESPKLKVEKPISQEPVTKKTKKKKAEKKKSLSESSVEEKKKSRKKKRKMEKKRKLKEKEKKARKKKEKLKAEKLRLKREKKKKQKEKERKTEKEILKKLKKEIEMSLEEVEREEMENKVVVREEIVKKLVENVEEKTVTVKLEKEESFPTGHVEDLRKFLDKKVGKVRDLREIVEGKKKAEKIKSEEAPRVEGSKKKQVKEGKREKKSRWQTGKDDFDILPKSVGIGDNFSMEMLSFPIEKRIIDYSEIEAFPKAMPIELKTEPPVHEETKDEIKSEKPPSKTKSTGETTPDTDEYHSNWESDDGLPSIVKKSDLSWNSDEEIFKDPILRKNLEDDFDLSIDTKKSSRRESRKRDSKRTSPMIRSPVYMDVDNEIKLLAEERKNLSKERMRLEIERIRIHELERRKSMEEIEYMNEEAFETSWKDPKKQSRWDLREDHVDSSTSKDAKGKRDDKSSVQKSVETVSKFPGKILSVSSSPEITSTKSPTPNVLENAYQEFMKAVSVGDDSKDFTVISSDSEVVQVRETKKQKAKMTRSERDKNWGSKTMSDENEDYLNTAGTTDPKVLQDILLPGEVPELVPVPVPSPKLEIVQHSSPVVAPVVLMPEPVFETPEELPERKVPFSFSSLVLPAKKPSLLEKSNWKIEEDTDEEQSAEGMNEDGKVEDCGVQEPSTDGTETEDKKMEKSVSGKREESKDSKVDDKKYEKTSKEKDRRSETEDKKKDDRNKRKRSRTRSPSNVSRDKKRREEYDRRKNDTSKRKDVFSRARDEESRRRERGKRPLSPRHREPSPRRRRLSSPAHRRSSPRRSPAKRKFDRRSPPRPSPPRRRRSPSPAKYTSQRRRTPSPKSPRFYHHRRSKSPGHSPMDGLKRSVADSTISDDLLPQPYLGESSNSPLSTSTPASSSRRARITLSPKRPSLDERINQVLGIEEVPVPSWKHEEQHNFQHQAYQEYHQQEYHMVSAPPATSKVVQVGNILQVVPTEEEVLPPEPPAASKVQRIVQVGNVLQVVPSEMESILVPPPPPPEVRPVEEPTPVLPPVIPEKKTAESILTEEMIAERDKKRKEKEDRRKEKERRKKEKDKRRKLKIKISTEEMIKRALEMDGLIQNEVEDFHKLVPEIINDTPGLDPSKSILSTSVQRCLQDASRLDRRKSVQFADGVRPGEGTSPSGGEELSSPPPQREDLLRPKKFRKTEASKKKKRKIKVKVIKKRPQTPDSDEDYENLPPPSPPPGSPPPHIFPPRVKVHTINNIPQHYLPTFGVTTAPQQQSPHVNMPVGFSTTPTAVYNTPPPQTSSHINVMGQHYPRTNHTQAVVSTPQLMHPPPQAVVSTPQLMHPPPQAVVSTPQLMHPPPQLVHPPPPIAHPPPQIVHPHSTVPHNPPYGSF